MQKQNEAAKGTNRRTDNRRQVRRQKDSARHANTEAHTDDNVVVRIHEEAERERGARRRSRANPGKETQLWRRRTTVGART